MKEMKTVKPFIWLAYEKHAKYVKIKKCKNGVKFKLRAGRYLYTLAVDEPTKIKKIRQSLPPGIIILFNVYIFFNLMHAHVEIEAFVTQPNKRLHQEYPSN